MRYISRDATGGFDLVHYEDYLARERTAMAACVHGADLLNIARFIPTSCESFHDARFESLAVRVGSAPSSDTQILTVELRLIGPYLDRHFELSYEAVTMCQFQAPAPTDDLLMHEVSLVGGAITHEFVFDHGAAVAITCREMRFIERIDTAP